MKRLQFARASIHEKAQVLEDEYMSGMIEDIRKDCVNQAASRECSRNNLESVSSHS